MIPTNGDDLKKGFTVVTRPSLTYALDFEAGRVTGTIDGLEAVRQAIYLALHVRRFAHEIYTRKFGCELDSLIGGQPPLVYAQIAQAIREALSVDDRITGVGDFTYHRTGKALEVRFLVKTIFGDSEEEVTVDV